MQTLKKFLRQNFIPLFFALCAILIELTAVYVTTGSLGVREPWLYLSVLCLFTAGQYFFPSNKARHIFSMAVLSVLAAGTLVLVVVFDMTGTVFDFSMLNLRNDAMAILESIPLNFVYTAVAGILISAFIAFGRSFDDGTPVGLTKARKGTVVAICVMCTFCFVGVAHTSLTRITTQDPVQEQVYGEDEGGYADLGVMGTFLTEVYVGLGQQVDVGDVQEIADFLYQEEAKPSYLHGVAKDYNVVTVLCESLEWFAFLRDDTLYPYGHKVSEDVLRSLYPNLYEFMESSYVMTNFHAREKTDISENLTLMGNYPLWYYTNYDYPENNLAHSLPHVMKNLYGVDSYSFHNGTETFYNRSEYLTNAIGFADFISSADMDMENAYYNGQRNLDSEMILACKEQMFPTDRRFNTYITTISMHGQYSHRENLQRHYDTLDSLGILPLTEGEDLDENANAFRYYAATAMELDAAVGEMMTYLREQDLLKNTVVVLFSDHSAYYQSMTNYIKDIYPQSDPTHVSELYRVPLMIKIGDQASQVVVDKFTCTADVLPTIMDLLGIRYYENLYYGHSVFAEEESILYSRAYDVFMTDKMYFTSMQHITWKDGTADEAYISQVAARAEKLMKKYGYVNRMFAGDYFRGERLQEFEENMRNLNAQ